MRVKTLLYSLVTNERVSQYGPKDGCEVGHHSEPVEQHRGVRVAEPDDPGDEQDQDSCTLRGQTREKWAGPVMSTSHSVVGESLTELRGQNERDGLRIGDFLFPFHGGSLCFVIE